MDNFGIIEDNNFYGWEIKGTVYSLLCSASYVCPSLWVSRCPLHDYMNGKGGERKAVFNFNENANWFKL